MRTGLDQGQIGPLRPWIFLPGTVRVDFLSCPTPVLSGRISLQPIAKLPSFLLKHFAVVLNYLPNDWILRGKAPGTGFILFSALEASSSFQQTIEKRKLLCHIAFLRKSKHLSLIPTLSGYALRVSWSRSKLALKSATEFFACVSHCLCLPRRWPASVSHILPPRSLLESWHDVGNIE